MKGREQGGSSVTLSRVLGQVARQLRDGRVAQEERQRQWQAMTAELDAARGEAARLYQALEERRGTLAKLEEEAREAVERAEGAERETTELRERVLELEGAASGWSGAVGERIAGVEAWCVEIERAMDGALVGCEQVALRQNGFGVLVGMDTQARRRLA